jgi:hypothetical protein
VQYDIICGTWYGVSVLFLVLIIGMITQVGTESSTELSRDVWDIHDQKENKSPKRDKIRKVKTFMKNECFKIVFNLPLHKFLGLIQGCIRQDGARTVQLLGSSNQQNPRKVKKERQPTQI